MANFLEVYNSVKLIENKDRKIICTGINIKNNKKVIIKLYKESDYNENDFIKLKNDVKLCRENKNTQPLVPILGLLFSWNYWHFCKFFQLKS